VQRGGGGGGVFTFKTFLEESHSIHLSSPHSSLFFTSHHVPLYPLCLGPRQGHGKEKNTLTHLFYIQEQGDAQLPFFFFFFFSFPLSPIPFWLVNPWGARGEKENNNARSIYYCDFFFLGVPENIWGNNTQETGTSLNVQKRDQRSSQGHPS
jgi:hypothetical protein